MGNRSARHKAPSLDQALPWPSEDGDTSGAHGGQHEAADEDRARDDCAPSPVQAEPTEHGAVFAQRDRLAAPRTTVVPANDGQRLRGGVRRAGGGRRSRVS